MGIWGSMRPQVSWVKVVESVVSVTSRAASVTITIGRLRRCCKHLRRTPRSPPAELNQLLVILTSLTYSKQDPMDWQPLRSARAEAKPQQPHGIRLRNALLSRKPAGASGVEADDETHHRPTPRSASRRGCGGSVARGKFGRRPRIDAGRLHPDHQTRIIGSPLSGRAGWPAPRRRR
jgi:hypothetical protein